MTPFRSIPIASIVLFSASLHAHALPGGVKDALAGERIGLLDAGGLRLTNGKCRDCASSRQSLWYFEDDLIAAPASAAVAAGVNAQLDRNDDVRQWAATAPARELVYPSVTWIGSPQIIDSAAIDSAGAAVTPAGGQAIALALTPKLSTNRSYADASTIRYFNQRPLRMRGAMTEKNGKPTFVARTIWPTDYAIDAVRLPLKPLAGIADLRGFVRDDSLGRDGTLSSRLVWERSPGAGRQLAGKPVLGFMLNGAQGDDDEAMGGHFAIATGRFGAKGEWADWAVNNFYNLDSVSEKGIVAATLPMDNYLMDLNSGQQYYRPSYMLVAILNKDRTAVAYQGGVQRTMNHFYRHDLTYAHAANNCAGISMDVFRALGWNVPTRGATGHIKALGAYAYVAAKEASLKKGRSIYDYLTEETTRLYPGIAFEAAGADLLELVGAMAAKPRVRTPYEQQLAEDVDAIILVKIPQIPSSRVAGSSPAFSFDEYMARVPADHAKWKVVPVAPRPFPAALRESGTALPAATSVVPLPVAAIGAAGLFGGGALWRRRKKKATAKT
ncbi:hypothetical protein Q4S45_00505 [Massilia sp. R2A-15]|uniref:hypothetical protein n=1 Tax=Massilia sp. R2A-15 TaxID=3064278 RepID=UPI002733E151|nr:hypothetical protein [Massilia sp. R2A-15]WLI89643.1 hypothetical protein Q4S45_00505 [Massilia sp. R2A-15]